MHEWKDGATILTAKLAVCKRCGGLRVTEAGRIHYIRRCESVRDERVSEGVEPPCIVVRRRASLTAW